MIAERRTEADDESDGMLDVGDLCRMLSYCPVTGHFTWLVDRNRPMAGTRAGCAGAKGYRRIMVAGVRYEEHRLAWLFGTGNHPRGLIDHKNGDPSDNRLENLREANRSQNAANKKRHVNGRSGLKGASFHKATGLWQAQIMKDGKKTYLGLFETAEAAHDAYVNAADRMFSSFARAA
jgi:hypothetical protein